MPRTACRDAPAAASFRARPMARIWTIRRQAGSRPAAGLSARPPQPRRDRQREGEAHQAPPRVSPAQRAAAAGKAKLSKEFSATRNHWYSSLRYGPYDSQIFLKRGLRLPVSS